MSSVDRSSAAKPKPQETKLRIKACRAVYHGSHPNGHTYTIYNIEAEKPDGGPVELDLRSFESLPVGELIDLDVERYAPQGETVSYTLSQKAGSKNADHIKKLQRQVERLESHLGLDPIEESE